MAKRATATRQAHLAWSHGGAAPVVIALRRLGQLVVAAQQAADPTQPHLPAPHRVSGRERVVAERSHKPAGGGAWVERVRVGACGDQACA